MVRVKKAWPVLAAMLLVAGCSQGASAGSGEDFPKRPLTVYVGFSAGGNSDLVARAAAQFLEKELGQSVIVENRPGASGAKAMQAMIAGGKDGYSLSVITNGTATAPLRENVGFTRDDYVPIGGISQIPAVIAVGEGSQFADAKSFLAHAKANPGKLKVGVPGATTTQANEIARMARLYDVELTAVPFPGEAEQITALLGKNVDALWIHLSPPVMQNVEAGKIVPLVATTEKRIDFIDPVPTLVELGYPELKYTYVSYGLAVPKGTPDAVVQRLDAALGKLPADAGTVEKIGGKSYIPTPYRDSAAFSSLIADLEKTFEKTTK